MLLRASPVEYLPLIEDRVFKTSHLNASPAAQMALVQELCLSEDKLE